MPKILGTYSVVDIQCWAVKSHIHSLQQTYRKLSGSERPSTITGLDQLTGLVDWTGGLTLKTIFTLFNKTYSPVELRGNLTSLLSAHTVMEQISIGLQYQWKALQPPMLSLYLLQWRQPVSMTTDESGELSAVITPYQHTMHHNAQVYISKQSNQVQYNVMFFSYKPCPHCQLSVLKVSWEIKCKRMGCYSLKSITCNFRALPLP